MKRHLDLRNAFAIVDFIDMAVEYVPEKDRKSYVKMAEDVEGGKDVHAERLAQVARNLAVVTWAARRATQRFIQTVGADAEWEALYKAVRPTTAILLKRLRSGSGAHTVDEALSSSDAPMAIHDDEEEEIALVRPQIWIDLWRTHQKNLSILLKEAEAELEAMKKRFKVMREIAARSSGQADQMLPKLELYEDRVFFGGEVIPLEVIDAELRFDMEDAEIPPTDDALVGAETLPVRFEVETQENEQQGEKDTEEQKEGERIVRKTRKKKGASDSV